jgi:hypothetical protein
MSDLITITKMNNSMLDPNMFTVTKHIEADLYMEAIQDVASLDGEDKLYVLLGKQIAEQIKDKNKE